MQYVVLGTELKINIHAEPIDGLSMDDYDFSCAFFVYRNRTASVSKSDMVRVDKDNYIAMIDTSVLGCGNLRIRMTAYVPDSNFKDMLRTEIAEARTDINLTN